MKQLFVGAEGTLGVITSAAFALPRAPAGHIFQPSNLKIEAEISFSQFRQHPQKLLPGCLFSIVFLFSLFQMLRSSNSNSYLAPSRSTPYLAPAYLHPGMLSYLVFRII